MYQLKITHTHTPQLVAELRFRRRCGKFFFAARWRSSPSCGVVHAKMRTPAEVRMSPLLLIMLLVLAVQCFAQPSSSFREDALPEDDATYADDGADEEPEESLFDSNPHWREFAGRLQRSVDAAGLIRARRWGNIANGALLAATGPVALTVSLFGLRLSNVVLSLYVAAFGGLLAGIELNATPITPWVSTNLNYLTTAEGRTAMLAFLGGLTFPLGKLGVVPAILTCLNAFFNSVRVPPPGRSIHPCALAPLPPAPHTLACAHVSHRISTHCSTSSPLMTASCTAQRPPRRGREYRRRRRAAT